MQSSRHYWQPSVVPHCEIVAPEVFNILQQLFFDPTNSESCIFFARRRFLFIPLSYSHGRFEARGHGLHVTVKTTFAWQNVTSYMRNACLNRGFFLTCLPRFHSPRLAIFLQLPWAISSVSLDDNVVLVLPYMFCNCSCCSVFVHMHLSLDFAIEIFLLLAIISLRNWGWAPHAGKYNNFAHRCTILVSFSLFLKVNSDIMIISYND